MGTKKLVECASVGIRTTEQLARKLDSLTAGQRDPRYSYRRLTTTAAETEVQAGARVDVSRITTPTMDRDWSIILTDGIELDDYRQNPVVLFNHDPDRPVGRNLWIKADQSGLVAKTQYPKRPSAHEGEWFPDFVFAMVEAEVLRGKSIGFIPLEIRDPTAEEIGRNPDLQMVITRSLMLEYLVVSLPSNPEALVETIGRGIGLQHWGWRVVGKVRGKPQAPRPARPKPPARIELDPERIADQALRNLLARWEV